MIKKKSNSNYIWDIMLENKLYLAIFIFLGACNIVLDIAEPLLAKNLIDKGLSFNSLNELLKISIAWVSVYIIKHISIFVFNMKIQYYKVDIGYKLRSTLFEHLLKLPLSYFGKNSTGYIMSRQIDDPEGIEGMMLYNITDSILAFLEFAAILTIMFKSSISLTLIALAIIIGDFSITFAFPLKRLYKDHNEAKAHINKELQDSISGIRLIKANYSINYELDRFKMVLHNYFNKRLKRDRIDIIRRSVGSFLRGLSTPLIIIIGGYFIFKGNLSVGCVMSFILYFQRLTTVFTPIVNFVPLYKIAKASSERMDEILSVQVEDDTIHDTEKNTIKGDIEFRNINFSYDGKQNVLKNINFKIKKGQTIAFVGPSGSGKSSLVQLLLRFYTPNGGDIFIDGKNITEYKLEDLRKSIGFVSQEPFLFNRSLYDNIVYNFNKTSFIDTKVKNALADTYIESVIDKIPEGINTIVGDRGSIFSGGEKQRICIAREIIKNPNILILDEATSSLDSISEEIVQSAINNVSKGRTSIVIAHKLSTIKNADCIYVIQDGCIVEYGKHDELIKRKGLYYSLYNKQNKEYQAAV